MEMGCMKVTRRKGIQCLQVLAIQAAKTTMKPINLSETR